MALQALPDGIHSDSEVADQSASRAFPDGTHSDSAVVDQFASPACLAETHSDSAVTDSSVASRACLAEMHVEERPAAEPSCPDEMRSVQAAFLGDPAERSVQQELELAAVDFVVPADRLDMDEDSRRCRQLAASVERALVRLDSDQALPEDRLLPADFPAKKLVDFAFRRLEDSSQGAFVESSPALELLIEPALGR